MFLQRKQILGNAEYSYIDYIFQYYNVCNKYHSILFVLIGLYLTSDNKIQLF